MATITRYVNTASTAGGDGTTNATAGANRAYATLSEWEAAEETDLVTDTDQHVVNCTGSTADTTACTIAGWTINATYTLTIQSSDNHGGVWDTGSYRLVRSTGNCLTLTTVGQNLEDAFFIDGLQFDITQSGGTQYCISSSGSGMTVTDTIFQSSSSGTDNGVSNSSSSQYIKFINCLFDSFEDRAYDDNSSSGSYLRMLNCTLVNNAAAIQYNNSSNRRPVLINNLFDNTADVSGTVNVHADSNNNVTTLASIGWDPDTGGGNDVTSATITFADAGSSDYHLAQTDVDAYRAGTSLAASSYYAFTTDIDGAARGTGSWDAGFDHLSAVVRYVLVDGTNTAGGTGTVNTNSGGNRAYVELSDAEAAEQIDLVAEARTMTFNCSGTQSDAAIAAVTGWTCNSTYFLKIECTDDHAGKWNTGIYHMSISSGFNAILEVAEDSTQVIGMQFKNTHGTEGTCLRVVTGGANSLIDRCISAEAAGSGSANAGFFVTNEQSGVVVRNSIAYGCYYGLFINYNASVESQNCTFVANGNYGIGSHSTVGTVATKNVYSGGNTTADYSQGTDTTPANFNFTTCISSDADVRSGVTASIAHSTANFQNVTAGTEDYHLAATPNSAFGNGTDYSGTYTLDIDQDTRSAWGIGADEYVSAGGSVGALLPGFKNTNIFRHMIGR